MKNHIVFDVTDANTIAASDSIGAFVRAGTDGDLIGSQTLDSQEWLNTAAILHDESGDVINSSNPLPVDIGSSTVNVDLDGIYNVSTNPNPDNVGICISLVKIASLPVPVLVPSYSVPS